MSNWKDVELKRLIMSTDTFIVFIDPEGDIDWRVDNYPWDEINTDKFNEVINRAATLEAIPWNGMDETFTQATKRLTAEAIARALDGDPESGNKMLVEVTKQLEARSREISRRWYLTSCYLAVAPLIPAGLALWIFREYITDNLGAIAFWLLMSAIGGAFGALFSVIVRSGTLKFETSSGKALHFLEGSSRIVTGLISGGLTGAAVKSGLILTPLVTDHNAGGATMIAAVAAGSAERLASSMLLSSSSDASKIIGAIDERPTAPTPQPKQPRRPPNRQRHRHA